MTKSTVTNNKADKGAHYRFEYNGVKLDVYRMITILGITHPVQQHMFKKLARGLGKGHTEQDLVNELQCCLTRWQEMIDEDAACAEPVVKKVRKPRKKKGELLNEIILGDAEIPTTVVDAPTFTKETKEIVDQMENVEVATVDDFNDLIDSIQED